MGILSRAVTVTGGVYAVRETLVHPESLRGESLRNAAITLSMVTGTAVAQQFVSHQFIDGLKDQYATAAVDSLTDDQLAAACEKLDLLYAEKYENVNDNVHKL